MTDHRRLLILLPFLFTPILSFQFRFVNAVIAPELVAAFDLAPATLGLVTSAYFIGFAVMQLPMGLMLDRFGPRPVKVGLLLTLAAGTILFAFAPGTTALLVGRFLMGVGCAGSVMAGLKAANIWFARERLPLINSILFSMTGVGGMIGTVPMARLVAQLDWSMAVLLLAALTIGVLLLIVIFVPAAPKATGPVPTVGQQIAGLGTVFASLHFWRHVPLLMTGVAAVASYQSLWAALWLRDNFGFDRDAQAWAMFVMLGSTFLGNFAFAWATQWLHRRQIPLIVPVLVAVVLSASCQVILAAGWTATPMPYWIAISLLFAGPLALFPIISQGFSPDLAGRASTSANMMGFLTSFTVQWAVGVVIQQFEQPGPDNYSVEGHRVGFFMVIALQVAALGWYAFATRIARRRAGATS